MGLHERSHGRQGVKKGVKGSNQQSTLIGDKSGLSWGHVWLPQT